MTGPILSAQDHRKYIEDGYLVLDPQIPESVIDGVIADLDGRYQQPLNGDGVLPPCRIQDAWKMSPNAHRVAVWPRLMAALQELYGRVPLPFQTLNFPTGTLQKVHSDSIHFSSCPVGYMSGVWVAFEDIDEDNGPLFYYPGSHKLPMFTMADVGVEPLEELYPEYEAYMESVVEHFGLERKLATVPKGHAFIWSANLLHGGAERRDLFRSRHSQVTHIYYEDCKYYTPMMSRGLDVLWRQPEFIPKDVDSVDHSKGAEAVYIKRDDSTDWDEEQAGEQG